MKGALDANFRSAGLLISSRLDGSHPDAFLLMLEEARTLHEPVSRKLVDYSDEHAYAPGKTRSVLRDGVREGKANYLLEGLGEEEAQGLSLFPVGTLMSRMASGLHTSS